MANPRKEMRFGFKQPLVGEKRSVTTLVTAAEETRTLSTMMAFCTGQHKFLMKVKNDHCSKFSNLSSWKEEAWKKN